MQRGAHTFVVWLKLGEFLLRSVEVISDSGRLLPFVGEAVGVLLMRSGDTCSYHHEHMHSRAEIKSSRVLTASLRDMAAAECVMLVLLSLQHGWLRGRGQECLGRMAAPSRS